MRRNVIAVVIAAVAGLAVGNLSRRQSAMAEAVRSVRDDQQLDFSEVAIETDHSTKFGRVLAVRTEDERGNVTSYRKANVSESPSSICRMIGVVNGKPTTIVVEW